MSVRPELLSPLARSKEADRESGFEARLKDAIEHLGEAKFEMAMCEDSGFFNEDADLLDKLWEEADEMVGKLKAILEKRGIRV